MHRTGGYNGDFFLSLNVNIIFKVSFYIKKYFKEKYERQVNSLVFSKLGQPWKTWKLNLAKLVKTFKSRDLFHKSYEADLIFPLVSAPAWFSSSKKYPSYLII